MTKYIIVNKNNNQHIHAIGFCSSYSNREEAEKNVNQWNNKPSWMNACKVKIEEIKI